MRIGIYNPYFDSLGGGERYCLTLAGHWSKTRSVDIFWDEVNILERAEKRFGVDLSGVNVVRNAFKGNNIPKKIFFSKRYDLIFFLSDGSIPLSFAKRNIIHFQSPFPHVSGNPPINPAKLGRYQAIVCNSQFTKKHVDREFGVNSIVVYPPVAVGQFAPAKKEHIIVTVGRFTSDSTNKKQKEMVQIFRKMTKDLPSWGLRLAGGLLSQDKSYFNEGVKETEGGPAYFFSN